MVDCDTAALALVSSGDLDGLRLRLKALSASSGAALAQPPDAADDDAGDDANPAVDALTSQGIEIANDLLRRGLPHLERAAAAEAAAQRWPPMPTAC